MVKNDKTRLGYGDKKWKLVSILLNRGLDNEHHMFIYLLVNVFDFACELHLLFSSLKVEVYMK